MERPSRGWTPWLIYGRPQQGTYIVQYWFILIYLHFVLLIRSNLSIFCLVYYCVGISAGVFSRSLKRITCFPKQKHLLVHLRKVCRVAVPQKSPPGVCRTRSRECSTKHQRVVTRWASSTQVFCLSLVIRSYFSVLSWSCIFFLFLHLFFWTVSP